MLQLLNPQRKEHLLSMCRPGEGPNTAVEKRDTRAVMGI
jgi:hypothetical protein